ncbi:lysylphosphatidylglycerol synthase transmembrane domain-containing protein [Candidatus Albibeggiatoa sp. nov. BB20]|uniref:lysylphosphatidylglycerol synthase transmembrane domain-containing protein n=1 Tax=Candidatus Albibeggiatoa sp. nov. BB20 TaxID=3162723 RepID=UPI0033656F12
MDKLPIKTSLSVTALAILAYFSYTLWIGWEETLGAIFRLGITGWIIILALSLINYGLRFARWQWYLSTTEYQDLTLIQSFRYYLVGFAFTTTPGKVGEMIRSVFLYSHNVSFPQSISMYFIERLSDLLTMVLLSALILSQFTAYAKWLIPPILVAAIILTVLQRPTLLQSVQNILHHYLPEKLDQLVSKIFELLSHARGLLTFKFLYGGLVLSLIAWSAEGLGFYLILYYLDVDISLALAIGIYAMSIVIGAASFMPGGLGGTEAAMLLFLVSLGVSQEVAFAATLICRFATLWFAVVLGALAMIGLDTRSLTQVEES